MCLLLACGAVIPFPVVVLPGVPAVSCAGGGPGVSWCTASCDRLHSIISVRTVTVTAVPTVPVVPVLMSVMNVTAVVS